MKRVVVIIVLVASVIGILTGVVVIVSNWQLAAQRDRTYWDVKQILCDLSCHSDMEGRLSATVVKDRAGRPLSSWRFANAALLLGDAVQTGYYGQHAYIDKPWDSPENHRYLSGPYREYMGSPLSYIDQKRPGNKARFVAIHGPGTGFDENKRISFRELPASLVLVVETRECKFHWMEPGGDLDIRTMPRQVGTVGGIGPASSTRGEFFIGFADRSVWLLRTDVPFDELAKFFTIVGANRHDREDVLRPYVVRVWK